MSVPFVVVYLGPSMPVAHARRILDGADYRPPIKRGDLTAIDPGTVVAMIDGVFEQERSISPREVHDALERGVVVFGGASMGALRAAEVPGVVGVGRIFEWYRDGIVTRDDEVALLFCERSGEALTAPTVNVRFAVDRLCRLGTIDRGLGHALIEAALELPFKERTYDAILAAAGLLDREDSRDLIAMLQSHDLKYSDARAVLEAVDRHLAQREPPGAIARAARAVAAPGRERADAGAPTGGDVHSVLIWESGDCVTQHELWEFLGYTGKLESYARAAACRFPAPEDGDFSDGLDAQSFFTAAARRWGWTTSEEAKVTLADLGIGVEELSRHLDHETARTAKARALTRTGAEPFRRAVFAEMFQRDLALKRETMRLGSVRALASQAAEPVTAAEVAETQTVLCKVNGEFDFPAVRRRWSSLGLNDAAAQESFVTLLARARRTAHRIARHMEATSQIEAGRLPSTADFGAFAPGSCPKPPGEARFCLPAAEAEAHARRLGQIIGVTRVGMIGELGDLGGIQVAQAARPGNAWSSSYGSGKSLSKEGAVAGSIMEEVEKWAQEQFKPSADLVTCRFAEARESGRFVDPATLDLPYDSVYEPAMTLQWYPCHDLLGNREILVPIDALQLTPRKHDIYVTRRGARKHFATNGLGAGFSLEEAVLHGLCEYVERHAQRLAEVLLSNPGGLGPHPFRFVDVTTASPAAQEIARRLSGRHATVRVLDITSEIRIPTMLASITRGWRRAEGFGTHPNPDVAIEMALLEAAQTIASATAGGREDLSINARSLGRHERPRPLQVADAWFWMDPDADAKAAPDVPGLVSDDVGADLAWSLARLRAAGLCQTLVVDLTPPGIAPARVVRVIVPGLETNNPFYTGPRARLLLLRDLLPRWRRADT